ncbi:type I-E CRISPR-associated protein Cas7/Cse4/CasC [Synechococcus elongatus]|uniref:type I-E CRISPR-associated protein Cas7/Cse4/CasC n=1 Tax=Synechococcus elongatus TaxID=32046 RepID=UPI0030D0A64F
MKLEIHVLQNFPPSNLNRDENGMPKSTQFGGFPRARISSQCQKRATRLYYQQYADLDQAHVAQRSRSWLPQLITKLTDQRIELAPAETAGKLALGKLGASFKENDQVSNTILFLGNTEIDEIAALLVQNWFSIAPEIAGKKPALPKEIEKGIEKVLQGSKKSGDVSLFGRMMASFPMGNVDAAVQVSHGISTNRLEQEFDFFTAVDDLAAEDSTGADHMGDTGYNSSCFYRFACLDIVQLQKNLGSETREELTQIARAFVEGFVLAVPSGYQNAFAAYTRPSAILLVARNGQPVSLVDAFETPVRPRASESLVELSLSRLDRQWQALQSLYGDGDVVYAGIACPDHLASNLTALSDKRVSSFADAVNAALAAAVVSNNAV